MKKNYKIRRVCWVHMFFGLFVFFFYKKLVISHQKILRRNKTKMVSDLQLIILQKNYCHAVLQPVSRKFSAIMN